MKQLAFVELYVDSKKREHSACRPCRFATLPGPTNPT